MSKLQSTRLFAIGYSIFNFFLFYLLFKSLVISIIAGVVSFCAIAMFAFTSDEEETTIPQFEK